MHSPETGSVAVRTEGLIKRFGREVALDGVSLSVPDGGVYLLAGTNGAGKSTLLRVLLNAEHPDAGHARVLGLDAALAGPAVRAQCGYVPETGEGAYRWLRADRFLAHVARFYPGWDSGYAAEIVKRLGVRLDRPLGTLSKGQARRVQIVAALAHRPRLLLLDELTDGLDPLVRFEALSLLAAHLADTGATAILSTHLVGEVDTLVDRVGVLRAGRLIAQQPLDALVSRVRRYHVDAPDGWTPSDPLTAAILRRDPSIGRAVRLVAAGTEDEIIAAVVASGAVVRDVTAVGLTDIVPILLQSENSHVFA
ncbi:MAG: ABC transporter ATP-binding protein [Sphingomonas sp.]|uniref:ABC transporter ATP-binding protein n=1 Tax=Sphingomonas sp. TaxID=28214 RepID=UPI00262F18F5|nr:ABC transporter ATP-binding protein [Sphingomonas sp.]MDK2768454.1 ABC transporter ATP-binding protein [Sphingomonas sp.]